ncbi:Conserved hypothetical protein; Putative Outer membrane protein [Bradyrhizobium sp. ORS 285]|uniref:outer membrane protein n=1 Tax=Bradyrhizobium sp. ORS 285 TaxID=115808 RepID=UPI0002405B74|nr:outer membrane beta-barrel protein [Bradyrhizobium sp. ORS 285]CCD84189.1 putative outer membrane protein precursor [Bradyrhizobium sp. ORS 285]SMX56582.1 Conserved hypothetical protein; Putative Outer membrane protein [Bradyrhizobium sp. ORS 285]
MNKFKFAIVSILSVAASTSALATDLAIQPIEFPAFSPPRPAVATIFDWSGFYAGVNGGGGFTRDERSASQFGPVGSYDAAGATGGGQFGYRWQSAGWVFGVEAQGNWANLSGSTPNLVDPRAIVASRTDAFGLFTGQVGYTVSNALLYVKGGAAVTDRNYRFFWPSGRLASETGYNVRLGAAIGAGLEVSLNQNWSFGLEYDRVFEGGHDATFTPPNGVGVSGFAAGGDANLVMGRLNYRFGNPLSAIRFP